MTRDKKIDLAEVGETRNGVEEKPQDDLFFDFFSAYTKNFVTERE